MKTIMENINELKQIAELCQSSELDIEKSLQYYEQSIVIAKQCLQQLNDSQGKLIELDKLRNNLDV